MLTAPDGYQPISINRTTRNAPTVRRVQRRLPEYRLLPVGFLWESEGRFGRYVKLHIAAIMCRSKLCGVRIARRLKFA